MKISEQLKAARAIIETPETWCQEGDYAKTLDGIGVYPWDENAYRFCSIGAMAKVAEINSSLELHEFNLGGETVSYFDRAIGLPASATWNDTSSHEEVMLAWDKAIALAEADEAKL